MLQKSGFSFPLWNQKSRFFCRTEPCTPKLPCTKQIVFFVLKKGCHRKNQTCQLHSNKCHLARHLKMLCFSPKKILPELVQECMTGISVQTGGKLHLCSMERLDQPGDSSAGDLFGMVRKRDPNSKANRYITSNVRG